MKFRLNIVSGVIAFFTSVTIVAADAAVGYALAVPIIILGSLATHSARMVNKWERSILLPFGHYKRTLKR